MWVFFSQSVFVLRVRVFLFGWLEQDVDDGKLCSHILVKPNLGGLWVRPIGNCSSYDLILGKEAFALA